MWLIKLRTVLQAGLCLELLLPDVHVQTCFSYTGNHG